MPTFSRVAAPLIAHFAGDDPFVSASGRRAMERAIAERGLPYTAYDYPGTGHWFPESADDAFSPDMAALALDRTASFLTAAAT